MQGIKTRATISQGAPKHTSATNSAATTSEASKMLEAALQQMDGIIGNSSVSGGNTMGVGAVTTLSERSLISATNVLTTANTLAMALQQVGVAAPSPDMETATIISDWLETHIPRQDADERLRRLQRDKESLALQYQMLAERVSEQSDKIIELEGLLAEKSQQLSAKEDVLQRQLLSRSALETQKLELMSALSELKLHRAALERENVELKGIEIEMPNGSLFKPPPYGSMGHLTQCHNSQFTPKTPPPSLRHQIQPQFHSLPRSHANRNNNNNRLLNNNNNNKSFDNNANKQQQRNVAFASNEKILIDDVPLGGNNSDLMYSSFMSGNASQTPSPTLKERSAKGLRQIFGKLRRSNSGNLELPSLEQAEPEFRRGGARATAGGRIEWTTQTSQLSSSSKGFADWTPQEVCDWLCDLGLGCYEEDCRKWLKANPSICFFTTSPVDIERELCLKTPLHRKKIQLAIDELTGKETDELALKAAELDVGWVLRWLDDIGLPLYKDSFTIAKVDGRMLHRLTMEDLAQMHVTSCLHIASLRCGIQIMRAMQWNPECLIRRSSKSTEIDDDSVADDTKSIALWTAHRVMEWLRVADLSEYAPNLRGAGVHGALMLYETRFNANLLADLLSISPSKTLLRRHLATHFKELLGREVIQSKRDAEAAPGYQALTMSAKLKPPKKLQFSLKRRKSTKGSCSPALAGGLSGEIEWSDYVCPLAITSNANNNTDTGTLNSSSTAQHSN